MSRIGSYGASQMYLSRLTAISNRMYTEQTQVSTELKSVNYTGIAGNANRLVNLENEKSRAEKYVSDNDLATTRLNAANVSMTAIEKEMKSFRERLNTYALYMSREEKDIKQLQEFAFQSMVNIQSYLSSNVDGQFIFSGGRVDDEPVKLPATELDDFQAIYDGSDHTFATTRSASLQELHTTNDDTGDLTMDATSGTITAAKAGSLLQVAPGSLVTVGDSASNDKSFTVQAVDPTNTVFRVSKLLTSAGETGVTISLPSETGEDLSAITPAEYGSVDFSSSGDTITFNAPNTFDTSKFAVGTVFKVSGSASVTDIDGKSKTNNGVFEISSISAGPPFQITVKSTKLTDEGPVAATLSSESWYRGDSVPMQQQVDSGRTVDLGLYANDPTFDKAFRAMAMIAQGTYGTAGGLENNLDRIDDARKLLQDGLSRNTTAPGPFGVEQLGDIEQLMAEVGNRLSLLNTSNEKHKSFMGFLSVRITNIASIDKTEAVTRLLDDQNALQTSYKALSTVRELSLINFMK